PADPRDQSSFPTRRSSDLRGRSFGPQDTVNLHRPAPARDGFSGTPRSVIIDESFAHRYFLGKDPIGQQIDDNQTDEKKHPPPMRSEEHTSELQSRSDLVCR